MTEHEWLACNNAQKILALLQGKASDRKLRLFACACCRCIWHLLKDERARHAVEIAERYADGLIERESLIQAAQAVPMPEWPGSGPEIFNWRLVTGGSAADMTDPRTYVWLTAESSGAELTPGLVATKWVEDGARFVSAPIQAGMLHDLLGNPFHALPAIDPSILVWNTAAVHRLAQSIYDDRAFTAMPVLGDALEEAACDNAAVLSHCRGSGPHIRRCWVLDILLEKA
jgi:hypothetical protein